MGRIKLVIIGVIIALSVSCTLFTNRTESTKIPHRTEFNIFEIPFRLYSTFTSTATASPLPTATATITQTRTKKPSPPASPTSVPSVSMTSTCRSAIDGLYNLRKNLGLPDHFNSGEAFRKSGDFDPNQYFPILDHLSLEYEYTLDYVYYTDDIGGKPMLYARKIGDPPFKSYDDYLASLGEERSGERSYNNLPHAFDYLDKIQVDGSEDGYFQFYVLSELGDQFYLYWHALYNDFIIICDNSDMQVVEHKLRNYNLTFPKDDWEKAKAIDFTPTVTINGEEVTDRLVIFSKWGGFWEEIVIFGKEDPYNNVLAYQQNAIVPYDCGILF
jgi:hypothetical protein